MLVFPLFYYVLLLFSVNILLLHIGLDQLFFQTQLIYCFLFFLQYKLSIYFLK